MKLSEVIISMIEAYVDIGDMNIEIRRHKDGDEKRYWATSAFTKNNAFIFGYDVKGRKSET